MLLRCAGPHSTNSQVGFVRIPNDRLRSLVESGDVVVSDTEHWFVEPIDLLPDAPAFARCEVTNVVRRSGLPLDREHPERSWVVNPEGYVFRAPCRDAVYVPLCRSCIQGIGGKDLFGDGFRVMRELRCRCCSSCSVFVYGFHDDCRVCFWEDDKTGSDPDWVSGANGVTLAEGHSNYLKFGACLEKFVPLVREPLFEDVLCIFAPSNLRWHPAFGP